MTTNDAPPTPSRLLKMSQVVDRTGLPKSTVYSRISDGSFPKQLHIGCSVRWLESEVEEWIQLQVRARDQALETGGTAGGIEGAGDPPRLAA